MTRPRFTWVENVLVIRPVVQWARWRASLAALSVLPFSLGTTQRFLKVAVTERAAFMVTVQLPLPVQAPDQPAKRERVEAAAVRVTVAPSRKAWVQLLPQLIPAGLELIVPAPLPARVRLSVWSASKVAVAAWSEPIDRVQLPVPEQAPDQPLKEEPVAGVAVSVTGPPLREAEQVEPQSIPAGLEVTEPEPLPALATVSVLSTR